MMHYSLQLFSNVCCAKIYPDILNISLSISIAHQSIDISKPNVCHLHYTMHVKKLLNKKNASSGTWTRRLQHTSPVSSCCATTYTKIQNYYNVSITGHKKLKKLDNVKIGNLKKKNRDHKKYLNKMKILVTCKFYYI